MAVKNISYPIYPISTRTEKGYITKSIPFFFCSVYVFGTNIIIMQLTSLKELKWLISDPNDII